MSSNSAGVALFCARACIGLFVCALIAGGGVLDLEVAKVLGHIQEDEKECLYNILGIDFTEHSWIHALNAMAYVEISFAGLLYLIILLGNYTLMACGMCLFFIALIASWITAGMFCNTYVRNWFWSKECGGDYVADVYGFVIGADLCLFFGLAGLCCIVFIFAAASADNEERNRNVDVV